MLRTVLSRHLQRQFSSMSSQTGQVQRHILLILLLARLQPFLRPILVSQHGVLAMRSTRRLLHPNKRSAAALCCHEMGVAAVGRSHCTFLVVLCQKYVRP